MCHGVLWESEDNLRCQSSPSISFETGSLVSSCISQASWLRGIQGFSGLCPPPALNRSSFNQFWGSKLRSSRLLSPENLNEIPGSSQHGDN